MFKMNNLPSIIWEFRGDYRFLSNFHLIDIEWDGVIYPSTEHAYQDSKTLDHEKRIEFLGLTCGKAKKLGKSLEVRTDWESVKYPIMFSLVEQKFKDAVLKEKLLSLDQYLIEGNVWHDNFFGACLCAKCIGIPKQNQLGNILMLVRQSLRGKHEKL